MKILFIVGHPKYLTGGAEIQALRIAIELTKLGHELYFLTGLKYRKKDEIDDKINISFYKEFKFFRLWSVYDSYRKIYQMKPDIVYMRWGIYACFSSLIYSKCYKIPTIWQVPSGRSLIKFSNVRDLVGSANLLSICKNICFEFVESLLQLTIIRKSDFIISQTDNNVRYLLERYKRTSLKILKGFPLNSNDIIKDYQFPLKIYFVRNIRSKSRINLFFETINLLLASEYKKMVEFHIIGDNQANINFFEITKLNPNIFYHGKISNDKVLKHLEKTNILIDTLSEYGELTTYSTAFIEAWANKVVILSFGTNPDNVLHNHKIGYKVMSPKECADKIIYFINNRDVLETMCNKAFNYVKVNHSLTSEVCQINKIMFDLIDKN